MTILCVTNAESVYRLYYEIIVFTAKLNPLYALLLHSFVICASIVGDLFNDSDFCWQKHWDWGSCELGISYYVRNCSVLYQALGYFRLNWLTFWYKKNMFFIPHRTHVTGTFTYICLIFMVFMHLTIQSSHGSVMGYEHHVARFPGFWISLTKTCRTLDTKEP